jgi:hypothetical protein
MFQTKNQKMLRYVLYGLLILVASALLLYFFVIRTLQIRHQKQNFAKAEASLDALEKQIEEKVGKPDQIKKDKSCSYISQEFGTGPRNCNINISFLFSNNDALASTEKMKKISAFTGTDIKDNLNKISQQGFRPLNERKINQIFYGDLGDQYDLSCALQYTFPVYPTQGNTIQPQDSEKFQVDIGCQGPAMIEIYPSRM